MMKRAGQTLLALFVAVICPLDALAQPSAIGIAPVELPKWDIGGTLGILDRGDSDDNLLTDDETIAWNLDVGRYLTTHLKLDGGVVLTRSQTAARRTAPTSGLPREYQVYEWAPTTVRPTIVSGALTYQFRDNEFVHPYISAGVRAVWQAEHTLRPEQTIRVRGVEYRIPGLDERTHSLIARPFFAIGCKSYFDERVFMRPEVQFAVGPSGYSHSTWRIGAGVDF